MKDQEVINALLVPPDNPQVRAILRLLGDLEQDAIDGATKSVAQYGICVSSIGGAEHLRMLRDRIQAIQAGRGEEYFERSTRED